MWTSDTSRFYHVGSGGTSLIGGSRAISVATDKGFTYPQRHQWVEEYGYVQVFGGSGGSTAVSYPNSGFSGVPVVTLTQNEISSAATVAIGTYGAIGCSATGFIIYGTGSSGVTFTYAWRSLGTRVL